VSEVVLLELQNLRLQFTDFPTIRYRYGTRWAIDGPCKRQKKNKKIPLSLLEWMEGIEVVVGKFFFFVCRSLGCTVQYEYYPQTVDDGAYSGAP